MKLVLPDACWRRDLASGALFLYFRDEPIGFTLHPSVSTFMTGVDPFDFFRLVEGRQPRWAQRFFDFVNNWMAYRAGLQNTGKLLEPLRGKAFKTIWLSYPRGGSAWESATELLLSSELPQADIVQSIDPFSAADELFSHIFFEKYLELYFPNHSPVNFIAMGMESVKSANKVPRIDVDWAQLYNYCEGLFTTSDLDQLLATAYMFRMPLLQRLDAVLLSNERLIPFLASLPVDSTGKPESKNPGDLLDVAAWEFFRQLVSPVVDPLDEGRVPKLSTLIRQKAEEIRRLKNRCLGLAQELGDEADLETLQKKIRNHIQVSVQKEVQAVLDLDKQAVDELLNSVFSDEKTWLGISALLYSLVNGGPILTAGSAVYALSNLGSKAFKAAADRKERLKVSDFALLYRMKGL